MKIICIGRNYAEHAKEMGANKPEQPIFFMKPDTALLPKHNPFYYPDFTSDLHHEIELVVRINRLGKNIGLQFAHEYYDEIGLGIDFTARDLQQKCKEKGLPWEIAKSFEHSAPLSEVFIPKSQLDMTLKIGDLIFTGTPSGVGPVQIGDHLEGTLNGKKLLNLKIK